MKIKYRKDALILFLILFFHIADCFSKEVYSIAFFNYMKNLMMLFFIINCLIQKKIKNTWFCRDDAKEILLMSAAFLLISIYQMVRNDTFNIVPFVGVFRILIPLAGAFYSVNIFKLEDITRILKVILCISFAAYILDLLLTHRFSIDAFFRLTLSGFNDVSTESDMFSPLSMGLCIYLCANERKNKWKLLSLIFVIMTNKRIMILYAFILFFLGQYLLKNTVKKRLVIVTAIGTVIVTAIYIQMNLQIIDDTIIRKLFNVNLDSFGMGRAWLYRNIYNSNYKSAGFQTLNSTKFVLRGAEMDFPNMYLEMGILAVLVCVYTIFKLIRANAYNYIIVTFVMAEMVTSHFIDITYFWIFFYLTIMEINKSQKISIREDYESGEKMNGQEKISVIIPVYNAEKYLKFCIESVLDPEIELILIDDGSTDQSAKIIEEYRNTYPHNIKTVFQQNGGVSKARNAGIQISTGRWILFLDADDYLTEDGVKTIKAYAKSDKNIVIFSSQRVLDHQPKISQGSHAEKNCITSQELMNHALRADGYSEFCSQHDFRSSCAKLIKKELLINYRFDTNIYIGEDFVFMLELYAASISNMVVDSAVYCYYVNVNSAVHSYHKGYSQNVMRVNKRIEQILRSNKSLECNDIKESFDLYKMDDLILLLKYDYFNSKNDMVWKARKKTVEDIINLFDFERLYQTIQREGNLTRIPKEKRIIYRLLFLKIYYPVYAIFRIKYGEK